MMAKRMKRTLALVLSLVMVLGLLPSAAFAARVEDGYDSTAQIVDAGGTRYFKKDGNGVAETTKEAGDAILEITKSVAGTMVENEFEITLQIKTTEDLTTIPGKTPDSAVVLVLDVSYSMDDCAKCGKENYCTAAGWQGTCGCKNYEPQKWSSDCKNCWHAKSSHHTDCVYEARLTQAKKAAKDFIDTFATQTGAQEGDKRLVQIIAFGSDAETYTSRWYDVNDAANGSANIRALKNIIGAGLDSGIRVGNGDGRGGTNIEGALMLTQNLLQAGQAVGGALENVDYLYTVLLTDGAPTYHVSGDDGSTRMVTGTRGGGSFTNTDDVRDVAGVASAIKGLASASKLFSIAYGKDVAGDKPFGSVSGINCPVPGTTWKKLTIGQWLGSFSTNAYEADDNQTLFDAFEAIGSTIRLAAQAWRVEDQMGANITYLGETTTGGFTNDVTPAEDNRFFQWNVLASGYDPAITTIKPAGSSEPSTYGYTMKYRIRLDNTDGSTAPYPTNTAATLKFMLTNDQGEWPSIGEGETAETYLKTVAFPVPTVKGNFGTLRFTKVDKNTQTALPGVTFTLTCDCKDPAHTKIASSSDTGTVSFTGIPSGHAYTLTEALPEGDIHDPDSIGVITVKVSGGDVYVNGQKNPKNLKLENTYLPGTRDLTVTKQWGATPDGLKTAVQVVYEQYLNHTKTATSDPVTLTAADGWTHTWNVPVRDTLTGEAYAYVVREYVNGAVAEGNQVSTINGKDYLVTYNDVNNTITNEIQNEMSIPVEKQWLTPDSMKGAVTVNLLRDGSPFQTLTLSGTKLSGAFENIPVYADDGSQYTYSLTETIAPDAGYSAHIVPNPDGGYTIQNVVNQTTVAVEGSKAWVDGNSGARPRNVAVSLWKTGSNTAQGTRTIGWNAETETYDWSYSFTGLDKYDLTRNETTGLWEGTGAEIEYYVTDDAEGYDAAAAYKGGDGLYNLTNTIEQVPMTIRVTKTWNDEGFEDERPDSLTFYLYGADKENALATLVLTAKEEEQDSEEPGATPPVIRYWEDSTTGSFEGTFPKYDATGAVIGYTVAEAEPDNYAAAVGAAVVDGSTIDFPVENTLNGDTTAVSVEKIWKDTSTDTERPKATVKLMDGSTVVDSIDLPREDDQGNLVNTYTFTGLTKYRDGGRIQYTVAEDAVDGYQTPVIAGSMEAGYTVTNTVEQQSGGEGVTVSGTKSWLPVTGIDHPASTTIQLQSDAAEAGVFADVTGKTAAAAAETGWTYTFTGLDRYAYDGDGGVREIQYKVTDAVDGYDTTGGARNAQGAYDLTNTFRQEYTSVSGKKVWVDGSSTVRPAGVTVALLADGVEVERQTISAVEGSSEWAFTFGVSDGSAALPKYSAYNTAIAYTVREAAPDGALVELPEGSVTYTVGDSTLTYDVTYGDNYTITNTKPQDYSNVTISKVWKDGSNAAGTRPATVSLTLLRNGSDYETVTLGPDESGTTVNGDTWSYTFTGLPKYDSSRNAYRYTVREDGLDADGRLPAAVEGECYTVSVNGRTVTNTIQQKTISISGEKKWENTPENWVAPETVTIELYKNSGTVLVGSVDLPKTAAPSASEPVESAPAELDWSYTFSDLPKYDRNDDGEGSGALIDYTLKEKGVLDNGAIIYTVKSDGKDRRDTYQVEYRTNEDGSRDVVNTWKDDEYYSYLVKATYISKVNGTTTTVTDVQVAGGRGDANETIRIASGDYTTYGGHSDYEYVLGSAKLNGETYQEAQKNFSFVLDDSSVVETLELTYYRETTTTDPDPDPGPSGTDYYRVIVNYLEEGTDKVLAGQYRSERIRSGSSWDVTEQTEKDIAGYEWVRVDGEPTGRNIQSNVVIDVYYTAVTEIPDQPTPEGGQPGETDIPDPSVPEGGAPDPAVPDPAVPDGGEIEIVDEGTPMGSLPQTGTVAAPVDPSVTLGLMALSASLSAAGLAFFIGRKKEEEN